MAARTQSKVPPKYKTKYRVRNWAAYEESLHPILSQNSAEVFVHRSVNSADLSDPSHRRVREAFPNVLLYCG